MGPFELDAEPASHPKFMCWNSTPQCDGVRNGTWESGWGEVRSRGWSLSALIESWESLLPVSTLPCEDTRS